ncbi:Mss4p nuclear export [Fusarium falciforme]|uniref:Protein BCP1 n=1 Tax=Fusarium falciforme TaxID=195108 RepID=A0A9W8RC15_9HYPO|nr:Protein BCP1 [Fusarium falciforme]KAJ4149817.1 Mss4p nuclear export [Fusarium falciforme]KAJ4192836.1 Mss4p nuclear export [Fusarium falciforme]KAJ4210382.1 Mss4p nuclear export [Fusarium falciforme]KAJ4253110.1 Mss4p nuclear export [Fusarium falciforme]WAO85521.1 Protein BCP1 [Fusarium falciforme]
MGKKRAREEGKDVPPADVDKMDEDGSDDEDFDMVNVEFEWFNFDPEVDFHGTKTLLRQLFDVDANLFNMSALADLVLSQPTIGSTIKVDGKANDAYALLTVLNTAVHQNKEPMNDILKYLVNKAQSNPSLAPVANVLNSGKHVGLIFSERLINMPSELAPPLYSMLIDEVEAAVEDKEPYEFSHYLILSKTYQELESKLDQENQKRKKAKEEAGVYYFHVEDEVLQKHAEAYGNFNYTKEDESVADSKRAFQEMGVKAHGHMILIEASKFPGAVKAVNEYLSAPQ